MSVDFDAQIPIFMQIGTWLKNAILSGAFVEETQIPSITEISVQYKINPATALKGVNILVEQGLLYKKRGLGMYVSPGAQTKLQQERRQQFYDSFILPVFAEAKKLNISAYDLQQMIERGYSHND